MRINVAQLLGEPTGSQRSYYVENLIDREDHGSVASSSGKVILTRTKYGILVTGKLTSNVEATCCRCLETAVCPVSFIVEEEFLPRDAIQIDIKAGYGSSETGIDHFHILDLGETIRQYADLALPAKPLCHPDCAGLCQRCGYNLNIGACQCPSPIKSRSL
jgi:uncharacterized protein